MPFDADDSTAPRSSAAEPTPAPAGVFSGRPWRRVPLPPAEVVERLGRDLPLDVPVSDRLLMLLASRGITAPPQLESFFYPSLGQLTDPFLLEEMDLAVDRVLNAVRREEKVALHGDFDVDGITGCALLTELCLGLRVAGRRIDLQPAFVPDRSRDGYGVAGRMVRQWAKQGVTLLITVDTGTAAHEEIALARENGLDVVVLDHHLGQGRPAAVALVNPQRAGASYPDGDLCGVAVAFKLAQALRRTEPDCLPPAFEESVLDLVCLGLVADQMSLIGENRILVRKGLVRFTERESIRPGLFALQSVAGLDRGFPVTAADLAYQIAPRLNACGRIGRVGTALDLLLTTDPAEAMDLAREADRTNQLRRRADLALKEEAVKMAAPFLEAGDLGLVLASPDWHKGVIGIGAARLVELFQLPAVLISIEGDRARGSVRSVPDIDVKEVLDRCSDLLIRHGGHAQAAGFTLRAEDIDAFRAAFLAALAAGPRRGPAPAEYDLDLPLAEMTTAAVAELVSELGQLEPFGAGNPKPVFRCSGLKLLRPPTPLGDGTHLRFAFRDPGGSALAGKPALAREFVAFGCGEAWRRWLAANPGVEDDLPERRWDILFQLGRSTFRPRSGAYDPVQQLLIDLRPAGWA